MPRRRRTFPPETVKLNVQEVRESIARTRRKQAALIVMQGAESDLGAHVLLDRPITIGRDPKCELPLQDDGISRLHCRVYYDGTRYVVEDLRSTNGTLVNGRRVDREVLLEPGDRIYLGGCVVKFTHGDALEVGYHAQMDALVGTDDLTGLIAKRRFDAAYGRAIEDARRSHAEVAVLMLDLDGLKDINDTWGHPMGAHAIAEVGRVIGDAVARHDGYATRFGGDEFVVFLPGAGKARGRALGEAIRCQVANYRLEKDGVVLRATISVGVSAFPEDGDGTEELLQRADEALYRAKRSGRDRVES